MPAVEICCTSCGETALARQESEYEGFTKVGEVAVCTACGARYPLADAPFVASRESPARSRLFSEAERPRPSALFSEDDRPSRPTLFSEEDKPDRPHIFSESERRRSCRYCAHYVVSVFEQRCGLSGAAVAATDLCDRFERKPESD